MINLEKILNTVKEQGVVPLFYHDDIAVCTGVIDALYKVGIRIVEFTNRGEKAPENFSKLVQLREERWPGLLLSVGTIKNAQQAKMFIDAHTDFIICPGVIPAVAETAAAANVVWVPGCMTPTEIMMAEQYGGKLVKLFPGNLLGPSFVSAVKELFPALMFMPTGGVEVDEQNMGAWFKAGVVAVGLGSKVISKDVLANKDYDTVSTLAAKALAIVQKLR
ncbi:bifunctional 4-hydroxy-2-oxoglutarate aldolase/2-dehydro-3-deoxy-phosphogluconate aldolase [Panacibacter sp. DH6]|uniref:Bifunctional 4-hydroxy-2-oxoglutarate aldolase/2-dehydro-3-deoxy-phosphogluconate aldolase n=1 Tax=Panacibacter microcysteis TaxID=2793269 RepID=A0A931GYQ1_9BACT|nr:bifunctional 4-hydroxy-2-oxoglutarate aldolase/2-dehydro-3-deoxy-phosphogluconate aldolase [Panacibacter microcysteis]MBG9377172.1 bifunctional 4-hydroxy-2-oxoglutarate aldolase/2-dehydro-3-deoxy-phosphogluconate aldolase [Panacibacter microcysteis]